MHAPKDTLDKIKKVIELKYTGLLLKVLNPESLSPAQKKDLIDNNVNLNDFLDLIRRIYTHNFNYDFNDSTKPTSLPELLVDFIANRTPTKDINTLAINYLEQSFILAVEQLKQKVISKISTILLDSTEASRREGLQDLGSTETIEGLFTEGTVNQITKQLRDSSKEFNRDWQRVTVTELSNLMGLAHADKIVAHNEHEAIDNLFVYRKPMSDACRWCKEFYLTPDDSPKLYRLSELLGNGSNYGKKNSQWLPVIGATHPWSRTSPPLQLKRGYEVNPDGTQSFVGIEGWDEYVENNL